MNKQIAPWLAVTALVLGAPAAAFDVTVSFPSELSAKPLDGRVLLLLSTDEEDEPRNQIAWDVTRSM